MDLPPGPASLHIGEYALEITHPSRQSLHFPQALMHRLQSLAHLLERLAKTLLQGGLEALVHRLAHLVQFRRVLLLHLLEPSVHGLAEVVQPFLVRLGERDQLSGERVQLALLLRAELTDAVDRRVAPALSPRRMTSSRTCCALLAASSRPRAISSRSKRSARSCPCPQLLQRRAYRSLAIAEKKQREHADHDEHEKDGDNGQRLGHLRPPRGGANSKSSTASEHGVALSPYHGGRTGLPPPWATDQSETPHPPSGRSIQLQGLARDARAYNEIVRVFASHLVTGWAIHTQVKKERRPCRCRL